MEAKTQDASAGIFEWLLEEISNAQSAGMEVAVDGKIYSLPADVEQMAVMENFCYMKSYSSDENGRIVRIDFDHIESV